jgi:hypothetical protein
LRKLLIRIGQRPIWVATLKKNLFYLILSGNNPDGCTVSFGPLGNFVYNQIIPLPRPVQNLPPPKKSEIKLNPDTRPFTTSECQEELIKWVDKQGCKGSRAAKTGEIDVSTFNALEVNVNETLFE